MFPDEIGELRFYSINKEHKTIEFVEFTTEDNYSCGEFSNSMISRELYSIPMEYFTLNEKDRSDYIKNDLKVKAEQEW